MYKNWFLLWHSKQFLCITCSEFVFFWARSCKSMNNLSSYCRLTDAKIRASDKDLPVTSDIVEFTEKKWEKKVKIPGAIGAKTDNLSSDTQALTVQIECAPYAMKKDIQDSIVQTSKSKEKMKTI
jgi:hypothetical protein